MSAMKRWRWALLPVAGAFLGGCSSDGSCTPACDASIHLVAEAGVPVDLTTVIVEVCKEGSCADVELPLHVDETTTVAGHDPALTVKLRRTDEPYADDLQGVFEFDVTWTSASARLMVGDAIEFSVTEPDGGLILLAGTGISSENFDACACPQVEWRTDR